MQLPPEASVQGGRFSYAQARAAGWTSRGLARAVADGLLLSPRTGVYRAVDDAARTHADDLRELLLARPSDWAAARRSAAAGFGLPLIGRAPSQPQLLRDRGGRAAEGMDRHQRVGSLPASHTVVHEGYLSCSPARAVIDIAREEPLRNGLVVADAALRRGVTRRELDEVLAGMRRWPGVRAARAVVDLADGRAESAGESLTRLAAHQAGVEVEPQVELLVDGLVVARFDLLVRSVLLAVEFNGAMKFDGKGVLPALLGRQEVIRDCRIDVVNVCWDEVFGATRAWQSRLLQRVADRSLPALPPGVELRSTSVRPQKPLLARSALRRVGGVNETREVVPSTPQRQAG